MKKIILLLTIATLICCKKDGKTPVLNEVNNTVAINETKEKVSLSSIGDTLISKSDFVNEISDNSDKKLQSSNLSRIKYDYDKFSSWNFNTIEEKKVGDITLKFQKDKKQRSDADIFVHINLSIYKNNKKVDTLTVYKQENFAEALVAITQYFYIDASLNLWTLETNEEEDGVKVISWNQYKVDNETAKINLIKEYISNKPKIVNNNKAVNVWIGKYLFEKTNRDDLKTSFNISINDLNSISIVYMADGEKPETYNNLKLEIVDTDKIKIVFNKKYDNMGVVYIQKNGNQYLISGEAISNINPGNDEYSIKKVD